MCIRDSQKPYVKGDTGSYGNDIMDRYKHGEFSSADSIRLDESLKYTTLKGRPVYGGGGIMPDVFVPIDTTGVNKYYREVRAKNVINQYVVKYVENHRKELQRQYPQENEFIDRFDVSDSMMTDFSSLAQSLGVEPDSAQITECAPFLKLVIKGLIGRDLFTPSTYSRIVNPINPIYKEALRIINSPQEYNSLLSNQK